MFHKRFVIPVLLALALAVAAIALRGKGRLPDTPEDAVRALFSAAQDGDAPAYLSLLAGPLRSSFEETQSQLGAAAFRDSLRNSVAGMKGFAVSGPAGTPEAGPSADRVTLDVELSFAERSERQRFGLVRQQGGWAIAAIDRAAIEKPPVAYGTPVFDVGTPEGPAARPPPGMDSDSFQEEPGDSVQ